MFLKMIGAILLLVVQLAVIALTRAQLIENVPDHLNVCFGRTSGRERSVTNCHNYFVCVEPGLPHAGLCTGETIYDPVTQQCTLRTDKLEKQCFACPSDELLVFLPVDFQAQQYIRCFHGVPQQRVCPKGLLFDSLTRTCNFPERVVFSCPSIDRPETTVFIRDHRNCSS